MAARVSGDDTPPPSSAPSGQVPAWSTRKEPIGPNNPWPPPVTATTQEEMAGQTTFGNAADGTCQANSMPVQVHGVGVTEWPCCGCNGARIFYSTIVTGLPGTYKMFMDRSQHTGEWAGPLPVETVQRVELSVAKGIQKRPMWGATPTSFVVNGELALTGLHIAGSIHFTSPGQLLQLSDIVCEGGVISENLAGQLRITGSQLLSTFGVAGSVFVEGSNLTTVTDSIFGQLVVVHLQDSSITHWPEWVEQLRVANATASTGCADSLGTAACAEKLQQGLECATAFCPLESCTCKLLILMYTA